MAFTLPKIPTINELAAKLPSYSTTPTAPTNTATRTISGPPAPKAPTVSVTPSSPSATSTVKTATAPTANLFNNGLNPNFQTPAAQTFINSQATGVPLQTSQPITAPQVQAPATSSIPKSAYLEFLRKQFNPEALGTASGNIDELNKRTSEELLRTRAREDQLRKNDIGQLESGQSYQLNEEARLSNRSLGDLAIAKGYATETYNRLLEAGATVYQAEEAARKEFETRSKSILTETAPALLAQLQSLPDKMSQDQFVRSKAAELGVSIDQMNAALQAAIKAGTKDPISLSEGETLYDPNTGEVIFKNPKTYAPSSSGSSGGGGYINPVTGQAELSPLARAVQNGTIPITSLSVKQRDSVAAELANFGQQSGRQQTLQQNLSVVNELLNNPAKNKISGFIQGKLGLGNLLPGSQLALNQFNQLKGILSLENREKLKGSGAISDFEFKVLSDAATALGRNLSDSDFNTQLGKIRDVFEGKYATSTSGAPGSGVTVQTPDGFLTFPDQASANAFRQAAGL